VGNQLSIKGLSLSEMPPQPVSAKSAAISGVQHRLLGLNEQASELWPNASPYRPQHDSNPTHGVDAKLKKR